MIRRYAPSIGAKRTCKNYIVYSNVGGTWSGLRCDNNQPVSGAVPAGNSVQTGCIVEDSLVLNSATVATSSDCTALPPGNAVSSGYVSSGLPGNVCGLTQTVYVAPPNVDIAPGIQVYTDQFMTQPLLGQTYIKNSFSEIFNINSNGIVGASTGQSC